MHGFRPATIPLVLAVVLGASTAAAQSPPSPAALAAVESFVDRWRSAWMAGQRPAPVVGCPTESGAVAGTRNEHRPCAVWTTDLIHLAPGASIPSDEARQIDANIPPMMRAGIRAARDSLITGLSEILTQFPHDAWTIGQLVRFQVDQARFDDAHQSARECRQITSESWWCRALRGYIHQHEGEFRRAEQEFRAVVQVGVDSVRCRWSDLRPLLDGELREQYGRLACGERGEPGLRDSLNQRIWWIADPLWSDDANERYTEHFSRHVMLKLRSGTPAASERRERDAGIDGDAVREMMIRYGWPSGVMGHFDLYSPARSHAIPGSDAVLDLATLADSGASHVHPTAVVAGTPDGTTGSAGRRPGWPREHFLNPRSRLVGLSYQSGVFRRDSSTLVAIGSMIPRAGAPPSDPQQQYQATLIGARWPWGHTADEARVVVDSPFTSRFHIQGNPQVLAIEVPLGGAPATYARLRIGAAPLPPLHELPVRTVAISTPVFIRPAPRHEDPIIRVIGSADRAIDRMHPSTALPASPVMIYWETYGFQATDSVRLSIRLIARDSHRERPGGIAAGEGAVPLPVITRSWVELPGTHTGVSWTSAAPARAREHALDLGRLAPGAYWLEVIATANDRSATGRQAFMVLPR